MVAYEMWHGVHVTSVHGCIYGCTPLCNDSTCVRVTFMRELEILARLMSRSPGGCQEHRSKLTTAATRVFWDKHKCTGMQTQNTNINTQTPRAHVYYGQICLFVWVACVSENTSNPLGCIDSWRLKRDWSENFDRLVRWRIGGCSQMFLPRHPSKPMSTTTRQSHQSAPHPRQ